MKRLPFILTILLLAGYVINGAAQDSWAKVQNDKQGEINVRFFNNPTFIENSQGKMDGIEYEIWELFKEYVWMTYEIKLSINYIQEKSFGSLYEKVKNGKNGDFGACSFSITEERKKEVDFTPKYMPDIEVLISSSNFPVFIDTVDLNKAKGTFVIVESTTYEEDLNQLKPWLKNPEIRYVSEAASVKKILNEQKNCFGFIELPNYFLSIQEGYNFKRQNLFKIEREGYAFIQPKKNDWKEVLDLFFSKKEVIAQINEILKVYLGEDVKDLLSDVNDSYKDEVLLLTKEKEFQQIELQNKALQLENANLEKMQSELEFQTSQETLFRRQFILLSGLIFLTTLIIIVYVAFRNKKKSNTEIQHKNKIVEKQLVEISDSINYAQHLQSAILPEAKDLKENLGEGFVMFLPKNVVSGDFYWMETMVERTYFAVADCTGHGVPGALVSVVCSNALNRAIKEFGISEPCQILDKTRELVIETFSKSGKNIQDGMDITLCMLQNNRLTFCGANNPLWIIRDKERPLIEGGIISETFEYENKRLIEIKGNKQPVGAYQRSKPFEQHEMELFKDDLVYIFSDGYADQFGGPFQRKFKYNQLKKLLLRYSGSEMNEQQSILEESFKDWKGELEQIDDVTIIGIKRD